MRRDINKAVLSATLFLCIVLLPVKAQQDTDSPPGYGELVQWAYGQDQELVNGLQYYNRHPRSLGHPYLLEGWVHQGSVSIRGKLYSNIWIKYDIYAQQVEVEYRTMGGADNQVILVSNRVDDFSIGNYFFKKMNLGEELDEEQNQEQFYQVIGDGGLVWYIRWDKNLVPLVGDPRFIEEYTSPKRSYLLKLDGSVQPFSNKKGFVKLFPENVQKDIKRLIKSNQLQIRTASTEQLELFIIAVGNLLEGDN
jgi:hypothetical protein